MPIIKLLRKPLPQKLIDILERFLQTDIRYLTRGSFWITLNQGVQFIAGMLLAIAFANLIEPETYGTYKFILSVAAILSITTLGSMGTAVNQAVARGFEGSLQHALRLKLMVGLLGMLGSLVAALYYYLNGNMELTFLFLLTAPFIGPSFSFTIYSDYLRGRKKFKTASQFGMVKGIIRVLLFIPMLYITGNVFYLIATHFILNTILGIVFYKLTLIKYPPNTDEDPQTIPYGLYLCALGIIPKIANEMDKLMLWFSFGPAQVAIYTFATMPVSQILNTIVGNVHSLAFPKWSATSEEVLKQTLPAKVLKSYLFIIPPIVIYIVLAPLLYSFVFPQYMESVWYSQLFALSLLIIPVSFFANTFVAKIKKKELFVNRVVMSLVRMALFVTLIPLYGVLGAVLAYLTANALFMIVAYVQFKRM